MLRSALQALARAFGPRKVSPVEARQIILRKRNLEIIRRSGEGKTAKAIGHDLGLHPSSVSRVLREARANALRAAQRNRNVRRVKP